jgi:hypothetical protein
MKIYTYAARLFALSCIILFFISCKKNSADDDLPANPSDSYISKITWTDSMSNPTPYKTQTFQYDNLKRLVFTREANDVDTIDLAFYYNNTDDLPFKAMSIYRYPSGPNNVLVADSSIIWFTYDGLGKRIKDSIINMGHAITVVGVPTYNYNVAVEKYSYSGNKMLRDGRDTTLIEIPSFPPQPAYIYRDTATLDGDGDVILHQQTFTSSPTSWDYVTDQITYDSKPGPFSRFSKFSLNLFPYTGSKYTFNTIWSKKNMLKIEEHYVDNSGNDYSIGVVYNYSGLFTYHSNGLPKQMIHNYMLGYNMYFEYTTL